MIQDNKIGSKELRKRFFNFMESKGHTVLPSDSLMPQNDSTTLFTGSGMQPMLPYLLGQEHPKGTRICDIQKCFRAGEFDEVGDNRHTTSFEMVGNWSFGDYFKQEQIEWIFEFFTDSKKGLGLDPERLYITTFIGDKGNKLPQDTEAVKIWKNLFSQKGIEVPVKEMGTSKEASEKGMEKEEGQNARIFYYDVKENWWSRSGVPNNMPIGEPGGPDSEMFYDYGHESIPEEKRIKHDKAFGEHCHPACDCGRFVEIGNNVFMTYKKISEGVFEELPKKNIDHGSGFERLLAANNNENDIFKTDLFEKARGVLEEKTHKKYHDAETQKDFRIILDHIKSAVFMLSEGLHPSNKDSGYILRKLMRKSVVALQRIDFPIEDIFLVAQSYFDVYEETYAFSKNEDFIKNELEKEASKFNSTLKNASKNLKKIIRKTEGKTIDAKNIFNLVTTFGLPLEIVQEKVAEAGYDFSQEEFEKEMKKHKEKSKTKESFKGGLGGHSPKEVAFHTATHLLLKGLQKYVDQNIHQKGSNITQERARFDFNHDQKVSRELLDKVEGFVNDAVQKEVPMKQTEMKKTEAMESGVEGSFWEKYPDIVKVWALEKDGEVFSKELCGGPHVENTKDISEFGLFKIKKESSSSAGVRRIKAVLEK